MFYFTMELLQCTFAVGASEKYPLLDDKEPWTMFSGDRWGGEGSLKDWLASGSLRPTCLRFHLSSTFGSSPSFIWGSLLKGLVSLAPSDSSFQGKVQYPIFKAFMCYLDNFQQISSIKYWVSPLWLWALHILYTCTNNLFSEHSPTFIMGHSTSWHRYSFTHARVLSHDCHYSIPQGMTTMHTCTEH